MSSVIKLKKILCFSVICFILFGFCGKVDALVFNSHGTLGGTSGPYSGAGFRAETTFEWFYPSYDAGLDAYCLNFSKQPPKSDLSLMTGLIANNVKPRIINIIRASEELNLSPAQRYYVTQSAIWYILYGTKPYYDPNSNFDGITDNFYNWLKANYSNSWNYLMDASLKDLGEPSMSIKGSSYDLEESGEYMVSSDFYISGKNIDGNYTVKIASGSTGACLLYGNDCSSSITISADEKFKVRVNKPADGDVYAAFTAEPTNVQKVYDIATYGGLYSQGFQNMAMLTQVDKPIKLSQAVKGNYEGKKDIQVQKVDKDTCSTDASTGEIDLSTCTKVAGAEFYILDSNDSKVASVISTGEGEENLRLSLPFGDYKMIEHSAPNGYYSSDDSVSFSVTSEGVKDSNGNIMSGTVPTIYYSNKKIKIKFRKLDRDGNPMEGIKFNIESYAALSFGVPNSRLCAYTDSQGYLTVPCTGDENTLNVNSSGEYTLGLDFGRDKDNYRIVEICENDSCKQYSEEHGYGVGFGNNSFSISDYGKNIVLSNNNLSLSYEGESDTPVVVMNMYNRNYIDIGKVDVTSGEELQGAHLIVSDPSITGDNVIDEWDSGTSVHRIIGIIPGHKYRLEETIAPENYYKMTTAIDFIMDEDGNVVTYDLDGNVITDLKGTNYELLVTNDKLKTIYVSKTSFVTGEELEGAEIKLCTQASYENALRSTGDGNNCTPDLQEWSWVSTKEQHKINKLEAGVYYLIETIAPEGYVRQTNAVSFELIAGQEIQQIEFKNEPTKLLISKKDFTTEDEIPGAKLKICTSESYEKDGINCSDNVEWSWTSGTEAHEITALPFGDYVLLETLPAENYEGGMIIDRDSTDLLSVYEFSISEANPNVKITVYNRLITNVPSTGLSTLNLFAIGGLMIFAGYETIKIYRKRASL